MLVLLFQVLRGEKLATEDTAMLVIVCTGPIVVIAGLLTFIIHVDFADVNHKWSGQQMRRNFVPSDVRNSPPIWKRSLVSGSFGSYSVFYKQMLSVRLYSEGIVVRTILSAPGLCLEYIPLSNVTGLELSTYPTFFKRYPALRIGFESNGKSDFVFIINGRIAELAQKIVELEPSIVLRDERDQK